MNTFIFIENELSNKVRNATKTKFEELLSEPHLESVKSPIKSPNEVATEIECAIYLKHLNIDRNYKSDFRRLVISLKDRKTQFIELLLDGKIEGTKFANLSSQELMSVDLRQNIETIKQENIRLSTLQESLPEDISAFKDGRDREKWGVEKSAAALDG